MKKFKTPVAMKVTQEQYEKDLKEPLLEMGHTEDESWNSKMNPTNECDYLIVGKSQEGDIQWHNHKGSSRTIPINHYNPELFLALASMTEGEDWIVGEWLKYKNEGDGLGIYQCKALCGYNLSFGMASLAGKDMYRKATTEELIAHLSKEFVLPEKWCIKQNISKEVCDWFKSFFTTNTANVDGNYRYLLYNNGTTDFDNNKRDYTEITFEQFKTHILKNNKTMKDSRFPFTLQPEDAKRIVKIACGDWKEKLVKGKNWGMNIAQDISITISEKFYKQMRAACDDKQHRLFDEIFGDDRNEVFEVGDRFTDIHNGHEVMLCLVAKNKLALIMLDSGDFYGHGRTLTFKEEISKYDLSYLIEGDFDDHLTKIN